MNAASGTPAPNRYATASDRAAFRPVHVVWEITLACDLKCGHCGSRAGRKRPGELTTAECLQVVSRLAELGTREVSLIGGEAYLRRDFSAIIAAITAAGMECTLQSGGRNLDDERVAAAAAAGLKAAGISIDGLRDWHDELRGVAGSFDAALAALRRLKAHGIPTGVNTTVSKRSIDQLDGLLDVLIEAGISAWTIGLTVPMGRASESWAMMIEPYRMRELMPKLGSLDRRARRHGIALQIANNVGYFGPYEGRLRGDGSGEMHYGGCPGGQNVMGIEADGTVKGCPSLPTELYGAGSARDIDLIEIWNEKPQIAFSRDANHAWGFCGTCYYRDVCKAGCTWMADSLMQRPGNNPYCHHRAETLDRQHLRESLRQIQPAPGRSFDRGLFEIVVETADGGPTTAAAQDLTPRDPAASRTELVVCYGCSRHVFAGTAICPFCASDVALAKRRRDEAVEQARHAIAVVRAHTGKAPGAVPG